MARSQNSFNPKNKKAKRKAACKKKEDETQEEERIAQRTIKRW